MVEVLAAKTDGDGTIHTLHSIVDGDGALDADVDVVILHLMQ